MRFNLLTLLGFTAAVAICAAITVNYHFACAVPMALMLLWAFVAAQWPKLGANLEVAAVVGILLIFCLLCWLAQEMDAWP
ncbi:hypothetical protein [Blastopirellula marina]|uniref:Uncharacterized protein n=1 Tax=Blastopirellula marina TaxID=124 RepID=A0A2S8GKT7_9BACT|nr:hypothetical protein [Blastopirellula marina]PQO45059.1 hypothetical protein C5Y93_16120 [Blastopirellula marina]